MAHTQTPFHITPPPPLRLTENKVEEWKMFTQNYAIITELAKKDKPYQKAILLYTMGPEGVHIYNTITFSASEQDDVKVIMKKMSEVIIGETNETYERYVFNKRDQRPGESVEAYSASLKELAKTCNFCDCMHDSLIRDRIVLGITDNATKKALLQKRKLTLREAIDTCKSSEADCQESQYIPPTSTFRRPRLFHLYSYGTPFILVSDHKPLELIFNNPKSQPPACIQCWSLRLQPYDFVVQYRSGKVDPADYFLRHATLTTDISPSALLAEEYVNFVVNSIIPRAMMIDDIKKGASEDSDYQTVLNAVCDNAWPSQRTDKLTAYYAVRNQPSVMEDNLLLRDHRTIVPISLRDHVIDLAHEGHVGVITTKQLLRTKVCFPQTTKFETVLHAKLYSMTMLGNP